MALNQYGMLITQIGTCVVMDLAFVSILLLATPRRLQSMASTALTSLMVFALVFLLKQMVGLFPVSTPLTQWKYNIETTEKILHKEYEFSELRPRSSIHCPKGYFIGEMEYYFYSDNNSLDNIKISVLKFEDQISLEFVNNIKNNSTFVDSNALYKLGPCPTLSLCLGYQACIFHLSNAFCKNDPHPGFRKKLKIKLSCAQDQLYSGNNDHSIDQGNKVKPVLTNMVVFITYKAYKLSDHTNTEIKISNIEEKNVFGVKCPSLMEAKQIG